MSATTGNEALAEVVPLPGARWADETPHPLWADGRMLDPTASAARVLRDGALVAVDAAVAAATVLAEPGGIVEVRVIGGPAAGAVHRLGIGRAELGTAADVDVRIDDPAAPPHAATLTVESRRVTVRGHGVLDGVPLAGTVEWPVGGVLAVGSSVLTLAASSAPDAELSPLGDGGLAYDRPPRPLTPALRRVLEVPRRPRKERHERLRPAVCLVLAAAGVVMAVLTRRWYWLLTALAYPVLQAGGWIGGRRHGHRSYRRAMREYRRRQADFDATLDRFLRADEAERRAAAPDPAEVLLTATGPRRRLWERRAGDPDLLHLRLGLADRRARVELAPGTGRGEDDDGGAFVMAGPPVARDVPVTLPLPALGVIGLSGPRDRSRALARWLVAQAAALHSPRDLAIVVLAADPDAAEHWNWVRWLPHCAPREGEECVALVGADSESVARRVTELAIRITERRRAADRQSGESAVPAAGRGTPARPYAILLVMDGARQLRRVPGMSQVLSGGPAVGLYAVCVDDDERLLPEECAAVVAWDWDRPTHLRTRGRGLESTGPILADQVSPAWCDRMARALAPVRDMSRDDAESAIPGEARLLDILGMPVPSVAYVQAIWASGGRTTSAPIGVDAEGPFSVDLRTDGPHGLVAGSTGAGTSELLQTLIASFAVVNRPDEMTFVLIAGEDDTTFADCAALPHVAGVLTDLDGHLVARALDSLRAELRRRDAVLRHAGADDIDQYHRLFDAGDPRASDRVPRLVIVIDEFARTAGGLPEFIAGLVGIGRRGRSLGVHLLLATRRPADALSPDISATTNLRIALRVTDADESAGIIGDPAAAGIARSMPGRCYVRSGSAPPRAVQSARVGGRRPGSTAARPHTVVVPWPGLGRPLADAETTGEAPASTDLRALVAAVREAAERAGIDEAAPPWLAPLPDVVTVDELPAVFADGDEVQPLAFGLTDLPATRSRGALTLDLVGGGHVYVAGSIRSGRSTALRTLAGALASSCAPADVHLYAIDFDAGALLPLAALPHCGAVVDGDRTERVERLLGRLHAEVARRRQMLAATGFASPAEQRAAVGPAERLPWMLLMLDGWERFVAAYEHHDSGRLVEAVLRLLREGAAAGLRAVFTGDRSGLGGRVSAVFGTRLVLRMADPADYPYAGIDERRVPARMPPGRVIEAGETGASVRESQIALLARDPSDTAQVAALQRLAREAETAYGRPPRDLRPLRVNELPAG